MKCSGCDTQLTSKDVDIALDRLSEGRIFHEKNMFESTKKIRKRMREMNLEDINSYLEKNYILCASCRRDLKINEIV